MPVEEDSLLTNEHGLTLSEVTEPLFEILLQSPDIQQIRDEGLMEEDDNSSSTSFDADEDDAATEINSELRHPSLDDQQLREPLLRQEELSEELNVKRKAAKEPSNEYESNDDIIYTAFPCLFPIGSGLRKSGPLTRADTRHIFTQLSGIFGKTHRFLFSLFDQMQRHNTTGNIASAVQNRPDSLEAFKTWVNDAAFLPSLERATKNPESKEAKEILARVMPHVKTLCLGDPCLIE